MKPVFAALVIQVGILFAISATAQDIARQSASGGSIVCNVSELDDPGTPEANQPSTEDAKRKLLSTIDGAYADLLAAEFGNLASKRSAEVQCQLDRYRARARELGPLRLATRLAYEQAVSELKSEEQIAHSLCLPYDFGSRDWKKCERAAAAKRAKLRNRLRGAEREWSRVDDPPDYGSDDGSAYWVTQAEAEKRFAAMDEANRSIEPQHLGPEVWCGESNLRRAETLLAPESEFMRVTNASEGAVRNVKNYEARYAQAFALERESTRQLGRPIRASTFGSQMAKLDEIRVALEGWRCQATWNDSRARELSDIPDVAALAYRDAKDAFDRLETQCDVHRPERQDWTLATGTQAGAWIQCLKSVESERDEKFDSLEEKKSLHEATQRAAFRVGSRE